MVKIQRLARFNEDMLSKESRLNDEFDNIVNTWNLTDAGTYSWTDSAAGMPNVRGFGALGDGVHDDTASIQKALDSVKSGGAIFFPSGNYKISATLQLTRGQTLIGTYTQGSYGGTTITQSAAVPVITLYNTGSVGAEEQDITISGFLLSGGTSSIYAPNGGVFVKLENLICAGISNACILLRGFVQQWKLRDVDLSGGQYGIYMNQTGVGTDGITLATPQLFDKNSFYTMTVHGQTINGIYINMNGGVAISNIFVGFHMDNITQDGVVINGLQNLAFVDVNTEAIGLTSGTPTAPTTATTTAGSANVTAASGTGYTNGQVVTIKGAGTNGADWYPTISSGGGTVNLVMTTTAPTAVTASEMVNYLYSGFKFSPSSSSTITFINAIIAGRGSSIAAMRYSIDASSASNVIVIGSTVDAAAIYDPGFSVSVFGGNVVNYYLRQPILVTVDSLITPTFGGLTSPRSLLPSPPGTDLTLSITDSNANGTGTYGVIEGRKLDGSRTQLFKFNSSGNLTFPISGAGIVGVTSGASPSAGNVGECSKSLISSPTNFPTSDQYGDLTNITLAAGSYLLSAQLFAGANGATVTSFRVGISTTTGNSATGLVFGDNVMVCRGPTAAADESCYIIDYLVNPSGSTTYYMKYWADYSVATPQARGRITWERIY